LAFYRAFFIDHPFLLLYIFIMKTGAIKLLVADADASVREIITYCAREQNWLADHAEDGVKAIKMLRHNHYKIIILEMELPVINGLMVCEQSLSSAPVIFMSRKSSEDALVDAFESGGNDFIIKPFYPRELVVRAKNLLRLTGAYTNNSADICAGALKINLNNRNVFADGRPIKLTPREYDLLLFFLRNQNRCLTRELLLNMVWGRQFDGTDRTVDTHVRSLRGKIQPHQAYIATIWGYGYMFKISEVI
jgi:DNA-binding response OmpR family regulator